MIPKGSSIRPSDESALDKALGAQRRLVNNGLGSPVSIFGKKAFTATPSRLYYVDTDPSDVGCALTNFQGSGGRVGDSFSVVNVGRKIVNVAPPANGTISGLQSFPLIGHGSSATFVMVGPDKYIYIASPQKMRWPVPAWGTNVPHNGLPVVSWAAPDSTTDRVYMRLSDGSMRVANASDLPTFNNGSFASGMIHFYAIPSGPSSFTLTAMQSVDPRTAGPAGPHKYVHTLYGNGTNYWTQAHVGGQWFYFYVSGPSLLSSTGAFTPSANTWRQVNGTTYHGNLTTTEPFVILPKGIANAVKLRSFAAITNTGVQSFHCVNGVTASPPATIPNTLFSFFSCLTSPTRYVSEQLRPITDAGLIFAFEAANSVSIFRLTLMGWNNSLWGID